MRVATELTKPNQKSAQVSKFVISLAASRQPLKVTDYPILSACSDRVFQARTQTLDGSRYALRLGLYKSRRTAQAALDNLIRFFPTATICEATPKEIATLIQQSGRLRPSSGEKNQKKKSVVRSASVKRSLTPDLVTIRQIPIAKSESLPVEEKRPRERAIPTSEKVSTKQRSWLTSATTGYSVIAICIALGWLQREEYYLSPESGLGYALGIVGSVGMLLLILYPLRKRVRFMRYLGATKHWFRSHMIIGVVAPTLVLFHSNFHLGSLNSRVALISMLAVALSGLFGRYIYAGIHHGLYGKRRTLEELQDEVRQTSDASSDALLPFVKQRLHKFDPIVLTPPLGLIESIVRSARLDILTRVESLFLKRDIKRQLKKLEPNSDIAAHTARLRRFTAVKINNHLSSVRRVARFNLFERLFALWHVFHYPLFLILMAAAIIHVLAVHMY